MATQAVRNGSASASTRALAPSTSNNALAQSTSSSKAVAASPSETFFTGLAKGNDVVKGCMQNDGAWPDLADHLSAAQYQYKLHLIPPWAPLQKRRVLSIPDAVIEASTSAEAYAAQGLFPEIQRAWIVIDTRLYLWNYLDASNTAFESYEHPDRVIQGVGLVKPKAGVFIDSISHVLVIATNASLTLLGLAFEAPSGPGSNGKAKELKLYQTEMSVSTEGVTMSDIQGTAAGRLFCKGSDGALYEVCYQAQEGWFSSRCFLRNVTSPKLAGLLPNPVKGKQTLERISVDASRNVLYALHKNNEIEIYHLPSTDSSKPPHSVAKARDICRHANMICPNTTALQASSFKITWMAPVSAAESRNVHLVAVTSSGARLYFTHSRGGLRGLGGYGAYGNASNAAPTCLELVYVRPPPAAGLQQTAEGGMALQQQQQQAQQLASGASGLLQDFPAQQPALSSIRHALYSEGTFLAAGPYANEPSGTMDCLLVVVRALPSTAGVGSASTTTVVTVGSAQAQPSELGDTATDILIRGATWALAEVPRQARLQDARLSPLARQVIAPPRAFLVLTSSGLEVLTEMRPLDTLRELLETGNVFDQTVHEFFKKYGQAQACAMSLAIASRNQQLAVAPEALLSSDASAESAPKALSQDVVSHAWRIFFDFGGHPKYEPPPFPSQPASEGKVTFSGRHDGLALYLSRLLRPFWQEKVAKKVEVKGEAAKIEPNLRSDALITAQRDLSSLQAFIESNAQLFGMGSSAAAARAGKVSTEGEQVAQRGEQESFDALRSLLSRTLEALSFVLLLIDYRMPTIAARCKPELQQRFLALSFADIVTTSDGRDAARGLVEAVIDAQIAAQVSIDAVADVLQERCGSFCDPDDVRLYKALECIRRAKGSKDDKEKAENLKESVRLLYRAARQLPLEKLKEVCKDYRELHFVSGAIDLPLRCAEIWDPSHAARAYHADGKPEGDARKAAHDRAFSCYNLVLELIQSLYEAQPAGQAASAAAKQDAARTIETQRSNALRQVEASTDPLFHVALYDWLLEKGRTDELLQMQTPFIQPYLQSEPTTLQRSLLLCRWLVNAGDSFSAARVYAGLAQEPTLDIGLVERVNYLALASSNARSTAANAHHHDLVDFTSDIEEKLEVAQVQVEVYRFVEEDVGLDEEQKASFLGVLDRELFDISTLYKEFVEPFHMHEVKLLVLHVSDHRDEELVRETWEALFDEASGDESKSQARRFENVASMVVEIGKRFVHSDVAFPVALLTDMLTRYAYSERTTQSIPAGWASLTLLKAGVPPELVYDQLESAFESRREPWATQSGLLWLVSDMAALIGDWCDEYTGESSDVGDGQHQPIGMRFIGPLPAKRLDDAISALLAALVNIPADASSVGGAKDAQGRRKEEVVNRLKVAQDGQIRRMF